MIRRVALALLLLGAPLPVSADEATILAEYWADSGSLPPEYAWETSVTIYANGQLTLKQCRGYETEGSACKTRKAKVPAAQLDAIRMAATDSGLAATPPRQTEDIPIGGGSAGGAVHLDGTRIALPSFPVEADAPRVAAVLATIRSAIPKRFSRFFGGE